MNVNKYFIADYSYGPNGESEWGNMYPECNGTMQSPIPLSAMTARPGFETQPLEITNYQLDPTQVIVNNDGKLGKSEVLNVIILIQPFCHG